MANPNLAHQSNTPTAADDADADAGRAATGQRSASRARAYEASGASSTNALVEQYAPLVKQIALHVKARLPASVLLDDLVQVGLIGLLEAARNHDPSQGASFFTYARIRIRGAILDELRRQDWLPRSVHRQSQEVARAIHAVEQREGRCARDREIAQEMGVSLADYQNLVSQGATARVFAFSELEHDESSSPMDDIQFDDDPARVLESDQTLDAMTDAVENLPPREKLVLSLYYDRQLNLKEIAAVLGVTESRVSQLHGQALLRLKSRVEY